METYKEQLAELQAKRHAHSLAIGAMYDEANRLLEEYIKLEKLAAAEDFLSDKTPDERDAIIHVHALNMQAQPGKVG